MKIYAERPGRAFAQFLGDLLVLAWIAAWVWLGMQLHDRLEALRQPAVRVGRASQGIADSLSNTGDQVRSIDFIGIGDVLAAPFDAIVAGAQELVTASDSSQASIARLADLSIPVVSVFPAVFALVLWLALRGRWIRRASAASRVRGTSGGDALLAAQALSSTRVDRMAELVSAGNPLDDPESRRRLAAYQLGRLGLRGPDER